MVIHVLMVTTALMVRAAQRHVLPVITVPTHRPAPLLVQGVGIGPIQIKTHATIIIMVLHVLLDTTALMARAAQLHVLPVITVPT